MEKPEILGPFDRNRVQSVNTSKSLTQQGDAKSCDINVIMRKHQQGQLVSHVVTQQGIYGDFANMPQSYHDAQNQVIAAQEMFMTVPAEIRAKFNNDPGLFLAFVQDPRNEDEMRDLGLLPSKLTAEPSSTPPPAAAQDPERGETPPEGDSTPPKGKKASPEAS